MVVNVIIPFTLVDYAKSRGIKDVQGFFVMYIDHCIGVEQGYSVDVLRDYFNKKSHQEIIEDFS